MGGKLQRLAKLPGGSQNPEAAACKLAAGWRRMAGSCQREQAGGILITGLDEAWELRAEKIEGMAGRRPAARNPSPATRRPQPPASSFTRTSLAITAMHTAILAGRAPHHVTRCVGRPRPLPPSAVAQTPPLSTAAPPRRPALPQAPFWSGAKPTSRVRTLAVPSCRCRSVSLFLPGLSLACHVTEPGRSGCAAWWGPGFSGSLSCPAASQTLTPFPIRRGTLFLSVRRPRPRLSLCFSPWPCPSSHSAAEARSAV